MSYVRKVNMNTEADTEAERTWPNDTLSLNYSSGNVAKLSEI